MMGGRERPLFTRKAPECGSGAVWRGWLSKGCLLATGVVGGLLCDGDVVRVALVHAGGSDSDELGVVEGFDVFGSTVAHSGADSAEELVDDLVERAFVGDACGDALLTKQEMFSIKLLNLLLQI